MGDRVKNIVKSVIKFFVRKIIIWALIIAIPIILLAAMAYFIFVWDDGGDDSKNYSNPSYASSQRTSNISINNDGTITSSMTAQEIWDKMEENDSRVDLYLSSSSELLKLMNAETVTQFLDTRQNPDEEINWESLNDVNSNTLQGIIKMKRADSNNVTSTMTYVDEETFQSYIDEYNKTGSEEAKKNALSHFTLGGTASAGGSLGFISSGTGEFTKYTDLTEEQIVKIASLCKQEQGTAKGAAAEASLMANRFELYGSKFGTGGAGLYKYVRESGWFANSKKIMDSKNASQEYIDVVKKVLVDGKRTLPGYIDEHVTFGAKWIETAKNDGTSINVTDRSAYIQHKTKIKQAGSVGGGEYTFYSFPTETSDPFGYISESKRQTIGDMYYDFDTGECINGTGNDSESVSQSVSTDEEWCWPTEKDQTRITSYFGKRVPPKSGASSDHGAIDIGVPKGTNVYACDAGTVKTAQNSGNAGNLVTIDHGNGYVTKYMHNSEFKVSVGDKVKKGQLIALSGNTGNSTGPHLHFQVEYNGTKVDPLDFKYNNGMGNGITSVESNNSER